MFCSKDKDKAELKNLDNFDVLSSDFEALKTPAASLTSEASAASLVSSTSTTLFTQRTHFLYRFLDGKKTTRSQFCVPDLQEIHRNLKQEKKILFSRVLFLENPFFVLFPE